MKIAMNTYGPWRLVDAEPVTLDPPHDKPFRFAVHCLPGDPISIWRVTNVETGMGVGGGLTKDRSHRRNQPHPWRIQRQPTAHPHQAPPPVRSCSPARNA